MLKVDRLFKILCLIQKPALKIKYKYRWKIQWKHIKFKLCLIRYRCIFIVVTNVHCTVWIWNSSIARYLRVKPKSRVCARTNLLALSGIAADNQSKAAIFNLSMPHQYWRKTELSKYCNLIVSDCEQNASILYPYFKSILHIRDHSQYLSLAERSTSGYVFRNL